MTRQECLCKDTGMDTTTNAPISYTTIHADLVDQILECLARSEDPNAEAVAEHVFADTDESPYRPWCEVVDLYPAEIETIRCALREFGSCDALTLFAETIEEAGA